MPDLSTLAELDMSRPTERSLYWTVRRVKGRRRELPEAKNLLRTAARVVKKKGRIEGDGRWPLDQCSGSGVYSP